MFNKSGSCLLLVTLISSIILIFTLNTWQNITFGTDLVRKKYLYERNFRLLEALHNFGVFRCLNNYRKLNSSNKGTAQTIVLYNGPWPLESDLSKTNLANLDIFTSQILLTLNDDIAIINSKLTNKETRETYSMESKIKKVKDPSEQTGTKFLLYDYNFK